MIGIVRVDTASDETLATAKEFGRSPTKEVLLTKDCPALIINRLLLPPTRAAICPLENEMASAQMSIRV